MAKIKIKFKSLIKHFVEWFSTPTTLDEYAHYYRSKIREDNLSQLESARLRTIHFQSRI